MTYLNASLGSLSISKSHTSHTVGFLVEKDDIGDFAEFGAFVAHVFFDFEHGGGIFLDRAERKRFSCGHRKKQGWWEAYFEFSQGKHVLQYHHFVPSRTCFLKRGDLVITPVGKLAAKMSIQIRQRYGCTHLFNFCVFLITFF